MEQFAAVMFEDIGQERGDRVFVRQTAHSLSAGMQAADAAAAKWGKAKKARQWGRCEGGWRILVAGQTGTGRLRQRLQKAVDTQLTKALKSHPRAGWCLENPIMEEPTAITNWKMSARTRKFAEILAVQRLMDGEARAELQGLPHKKCPWCGTGTDQWRHWMFRCEAIKE